ncbi:MAG: cation diffusion facilitator family transporter [Candidatus Hydrogenedens sp.]|nr:cation diffusion facilitator family transporter [Candidatus Hydrogenedens sp.]
MAKLVAGTLGHSIALLSDSVNSLGDAAASCVALISLWYSQKPADSTHPYGHMRAEAVGALTISTLIVVSALLIGWEAMQHLGQDHLVPPAWTLWVAGANVVIKELLYQFTARAGRKTGSRTIVANAWDHRSDALCSLGAMVGLLGVRYGGPQMLWFDEAAALFIVAIIILGGIKLYADSASDLMDRQAGESFTRQIRNAALEVPGVQDVEKLWMRKAGLEYLIDIHIEVDPCMEVRLGHEIGHAVQDVLQQRFPRVRAVLVHLEPHS